MKAISVDARLNVQKMFIWSLRDLKNTISQPARDVPGTSPEGSTPKGRNVRDLQGTFRGLLGDQQKKWQFYEKSAF